MITIVTVNECQFNSGAGQASVIEFEATGVPDPSSMSATIGGANASDFSVGSTAAGSPANWYTTQITSLVALPNSVEITITITSGDLTSNCCIVPAPDHDP